MRALAWLRTRLRAIFQPGSVERDLHDELQSHLDRQVELLIASGSTPAEARAEARRAFAGVAQAEEACRDARGIRLFTELGQDVRYGARIMRASPALSAVIVVTLGIAIGANTALFGIFDAVLLKALPLSDADRLVVVAEDSPSVHGMGASYPDYLDWRAKQTTFDDLAASMIIGGVLTGGAEPDRVFGRAVSAQFFATIGARFAAGRAFADVEDRPNGPQAVILSYALWQRRYGGDRSAIGRIVSYNGDPCTIVGILSEDFEFYGTANNDFFLPLGRMTDQPFMHDRRSHPAIAVVGRVRRGVTLRQAVADLGAIAGTLAAAYPATNAGETVAVQSLLDDYVGSTRLTLWMLLASALFVLTIACANVANLLLVRAHARRREIAMRLALGAGRWRILRQLLTESLLLACCGGVAGALAGWWGTRALASVASRTLPRLGHASLDWRALAFTLTVTATAGIVFGCVPAWQTSRVDVQPALRESGRGVTRAGHRLRDGLLVAEIALALALLVGAGLLLRSFSRLVQVDPGYDARGVLTLRLRFPDADYRDREKVTAALRDILARLSALPGVEAASLTTGVPMGRSFPERFAVDGLVDLPVQQSPLTQTQWVSPEYFRTFGIGLVAGRIFRATDDDRAALVAVVDDDFVRKYFPNRPAAAAISARIKFYDTDPRWREIVGVVRHVRQGPLDERGGVEAYGPYDQLEPHWQTEIGRAMDVGVRSRIDPAALTEAIKHQVQAVDPDVPISHVRTLREAVSLSIAPRLLNLSLVGGFAAVALVLCVVGVYGVMSYAVTERTRELGVRLALGAAPSRVLAMVLAHALRVAVSGAAIGALGALVLSRVMAGLLYAVGPADPLTFTAVVAIVLFVALLASSVPARRAMRMDPLAALRDE
jgi:putative ABC transport system permease protein